MDEYQIEREKRRRETLQLEATAAVHHHQFAPPTSNQFLLSSTLPLTQRFNPDQYQHQNLYFLQSAEPEFHQVQLGIVSEPSTSSTLPMNFPAAIGLEPQWQANPKVHELVEKFAKWTLANPGVKGVFDLLVENIKSLMPNEQLGNEEEFRHNLKKMVRRVKEKLRKEREETSKSEQNEKQEKSVAAVLDWQMDEEADEDESFDNPESSGYTGDNSAGSWIQQEDANLEMACSSSSLLPFNAGGIGQLLVEKFEEIEAEEAAAIQRNDNIANPASVRRTSSTSSSSTQSSAGTSVDFSGKHFARRTIPFESGPNLTGPKYTLQDLEAAGICTEYHPKPVMKMPKMPIVRIFLERSSAEIIQHQPSDSEEDEEEPLPRLKKKIRISPTPSLSPPPTPTHLTPFKPAQSRNTRRSNTTIQPLEELHRQLAPKTAKSLQYLAKCDQCGWESTSDGQLALHMLRCHQIFVDQNRAVMDCLRGMDKQTIEGIKWRCQNCAMINDNDFVTPHLLLDHQQRNPECKSKQNRAKRFQLTDVIELYEDLVG